MDMANSNDNSSDKQPIISIDFAPDDEPRAVEQINGDLLLPAAGRPLIEQALLMAEEALPDECAVELKSIDDARRMLGIEKVDSDRARELAQMLLVRPI
jgi:23S rRNA U2552 (ribose-2'-O)-methylase RlmE/FtsJ